MVDTNAQELSADAESNCTDAVDSSEVKDKAEAVDDLTITALLDTITGLGTDAKQIDLNTATTIIMRAKEAKPCDSEEWLCLLRPGLTAAHRGQVFSYPGSAGGEEKLVCARVYPGSPGGQIQRQGGTPH